MGFLDYLDDKSEFKAPPKPKKKKQSKKKIVESVIEEEILVDEEITEASEFVITDMGGKISFGEEITLHRYAVWNEGTIVDMSNDLITLRETYGNLDILSRENKVNESKKYSIKKKKTKKIIKNSDGQTIEPQMSEGIDRASSILEGVPETDSDDAQMTPLGESGAPAVMASNSSDVANHASSLLV